MTLTARPTPAQAIALGKVSRAADRLRDARATVEERIRQAAFEELEQLRYAVKLEVQNAYAIKDSGNPMAKVLLKRALGTKDHTTLEEYLSGFEDSTIDEVQYEFDLSDRFNPSIRIAFWVNSQGMRFDGPEVLSFNMGGYPNYSADGAIYSQLSADDEIAFLTQMREKMMEAKNAG